LMVDNFYSFGDADLCKYHAPCLKIRPHKRAPRPEGAAGQNLTFLLYAEYRLFANKTVIVIFELGVGAW
jgi:hypothetical protein